MADALRYFSFRELSNLIICILLDVVDYVIPILRTPLIGDLLFDVLGLVIAIILFGWIGLISLLEFVPSFDIIPMSTVNWLIWIFLKRNQDAFFKSSADGYKKWRFDRF